MERLRDMHRCSFSRVAYPNRHASTTIYPQPDAFFGVYSPYPRCPLPHRANAPSLNQLPTCRCLCPTSKSWTVLGFMRRCISRCLSLLLLPSSSATSSISFSSRAHFSSRRHHTRLPTGRARTRRVRIGGGQTNTIYPSFTVYALLRSKNNIETKPFESVSIERHGRSAHVLTRMHHKRARLGCTCAQIIPAKSAVL